MGLPRIAGGALVALQILLAPAIAASECQSVTIKTPDGPLRGIEDVAPLKFGARLVLSAYDRRATEEALDDGRDPPPGGLYSIALDDLRNGLDVVESHPVRLYLEDPDFRPHGIDIYPVGWDAWWAAVDRRYQREDSNDVQLEGWISLYKGKAGSITRQKHGFFEHSCRMNDVAFADESTIFLTLDGKACGGPALWWERLTNSAAGSLVRWDMSVGFGLVPVLEGLSFPNGVAVDRGANRLWVAETRAERLVAYDLEKALQHPPQMEVVARVPLEGAPDNLTLRKDGGVTAAVSRSAFRMFLFMQGLADPPLADAVEVSADGEVLPSSGAAAPGATVAYADGGGMTVLASGWGEGLTVCREAE